MCAGKAKAAAGTRPCLAEVRRTHRIGLAGRHRRQEGVKRGAQATVIWWLTPAFVGGK